MALEFSPETLKTFEATVARYPKKEAAMLPVLYLAQREFGHLGSGGDRICRPADGSGAGAGHGVVSFYTMYNMKPIGRHHIQVCRTLAVRAARRRGSDELSQEETWHRMRPDDRGWQVHACGSRVFSVLRHGADDAS